MLLLISLSPELANTYQYICVRLLTPQQSSLVMLPTLAVELAVVMESVGRLDTKEHGTPSSAATTCITYIHIQ